MIHIWYFTIQIPGVEVSIWTKFKLYTQIGVLNLHTWEVHKRGFKLYTLICEIAYE